MTRFKTKANTLFLDINFIFVSHDSFSTLRKSSVASINQQEIFNVSKPMKPFSRVYGIIRVSTKKQVDKTSLLHQERAIRMYCKFKKYELIRIYKEKGRSAYKGLDQRPEVRQMQRDALEDKVNGIVFYDLTRASRNPREYDNFKDWLRLHHISMEYVTQVFTADPEGELIEDVLVRIAKYTSQKTGQKAKDGMQERAKQGIHIATPPLGYTRAKIGKDKGKLVPNKYHKYVVQAWKMRLQRKTLKEIHDYLVKHDVRNFKNKQPTLKNISQIFVQQNYFYAGYVKFNNEMYKGIHKKILNPIEYRLSKRLIITNTNKRMENLPNYSRKWLYGRGFDSVKN